MRQAIHKQNNRPTIPDTFIINGNQTEISMKLQKRSITFVCKYRRTNSKILPQPTHSFSDYLNGNYAANLFMFPTCEAEILHTTTNLKASTSEGCDNISTQILKQTMKEAATPLNHNCKHITILWHIPKRHETCQNCSYFQKWKHKTIK